MVNRQPQPRDHRDPNDRAVCFPALLLLQRRSGEYGVQSPSIYARDRKQPCRCGHSKTIHYVTQIKLGREAATSAPSGLQMPRLQACESIRQHTLSPPSWEHRRYPRFQPNSPTYVAAIANAVAGPEETLSGWRTPPNSKGATIFSSQRESRPMTAIGAVRI